MGHIENRLSELSTLQDGWLNGEGKAIPAEVIALASYVIPKLLHGRPDHNPYIYPMPVGAVSVEVERGSHLWDLSIYADKIEANCCYYKENADDDKELVLEGLSKEDYVAVLDDWVEFL